MLRKSDLKGNETLGERSELQDGVVAPAHRDRAQISRGRGRGGHDLAVERIGKERRYVLRHPRLRLRISNWPGLFRGPGGRCLVEKQRAAQLHQVFARAVLRAKLFYTEAQPGQGTDNLRDVAAVIGLQALIGPVRILYRLAERQSAGGGGAMITIILEGTGLGRLAVGPDSYQNAITCDVRKEDFLAFAYGGPERQTLALRGVFEGRDQRSHILFDVVGSFIGNGERTAFGLE